MTRLKKKIITAFSVVILIISVAVIILIHSSNNYIKLNNEDEIFLLLLESDCEPVSKAFTETNKVTIPCDSNGFYGTYCELQKEQGLPLEYFSGEEATEYICQLENNRYAQILICDNILVGAMLYDKFSSELSGVNLISN